MTKIKEKEIAPEPTIDNNLELIKHIGEVHTDIPEITSDFIYAKLTDKDKDGVRETTHNAYYGVKLLNALKEKAYRWKYTEGKCPPCCI